MPHDADGDAFEIVITLFWRQAHLDGDGGEPSGGDGDWDGSNSAVFRGCGADDDCSGDGGDTAGGSLSGKIGRVGVLLESSRVVLMLLTVFGKVGC